MYAIIKTGGKQYRVSEGDEIYIEKLAGEVSDKIEFNEVLAVSDEGNFKVGQPYLESAKVEAEILAHGKQKKIYVMKYKPKKGYRRRNGHRQPYTKVKINKITA